MKRDSGLQSRVVAAVKNIENVSAVEVVVTLSPRAIRPTVPVLASALAACIFVLIIYPILFADAEPLTVSADCIFIAAAAALLAGSFPPLQRFFFSGRCMHEAAVAAARAEFIRQGIHCTIRRTGLLVYLSVFEHQVVLVPDMGIKAIIPAEEWDRLEQAAAIYKSPAPYVQLMVFLELLQQISGRYLPKQEDDSNELPDDVRYS